MRLLAAAFVASLLPAGAAAATPLQGDSLWTARSPAAIEPGALAAEVAAAGARTVFVKAADGAALDPGFTAPFVDAVRGRGISICAWVFAYGSDPVHEAEAAAGAARAGAQCLVVDAEGQYEKRYGEAQTYVRELRALLGRAFPIGLAGQAEVLEHQEFPYSVFLGPGGFQYDMPQVYWRELSLSPSSALSLSFAQNEWYGRPIAPVGQLFDGVSSAEAWQFVAGASIDGAAGLSFFDLEAMPAAAIATALQEPVPALRRLIAPATLHVAADGDEVVWAQEHLNGAGARLPVGGFYGNQTAKAVARFQRRHRLHATGVLDGRTWRALLRVRPRVPSWASGPPLSAR